MKKIDDTLVVELSSTKVPGKVITVEYRDPLRGLRINQHRPDTCRIVHVGKDFVKKQPTWVGFITNIEIQRDTRSGKEFMKDLYNIDAYIFVNRIGVK